MNEASRGIEQYLDECFAQFVQPLIAELQLPQPSKTVGNLGAIYEINRHGNVALRLVNDRGLVSLEVARTNSDDWWDLELLADLLEPEKRPRRGVRRLDLEHQVALLRGHWPRLQRLFSWPTVLFTRRKLSSLGQDRARTLFGPNAV